MTMRLLRYRSAKDVEARSITVNRCYHGKLLGWHVQWGTRCYSIMWRLCK